MSNVKEYFDKWLSPKEFADTMRVFMFRAVILQFESQDMVTTDLENGYYHLYRFVEAVERDMEEGNI